MPKAGRLREQVENHGRACNQVLVFPKAELGFFHFLETVTGWLVPSAVQKNPVQAGQYLPLQKIPLAGNRFLEASKRAENTKEKSRQCFGGGGLKWKDTVGDKHTSRIQTVLLTVHT